jgi:hypothetical protein
VIVADAQAEVPTVVLVQYLWLPGVFPANNDLLSMARADGWYACEGKYRRKRGQRGSGRKPAVSYADRVRGIRDAANMHARAARLAPVHLCDLHFALIGQDKYDPSAWYLAAKAIEDGLADAGVFDSDRFGVRNLSGRCIRGAAEAVALLEGAALRVRSVVGMLVTLTEIGAGDVDPGTVP